MKTKFNCFLLLLFFSVNVSFAQKGKPKEKTGVTAKYEASGPFCNGIARVRLNHKWGFIDTTGNVIVPPKYNEVTNFNEGLAKIRLGEKWGLIDTKGTIIIKPTFDFIDEFIEGKAKVKLDGQIYYMNKQGVRVDK